MLKTQMKAKMPTKRLENLADSPVWVRKEYDPKVTLLKGAVEGGQWEICKHAYSSMPLGPVPSRMACPPG